MNTIPKLKEQLDSLHNTFLEDPKDLMVYAEFGLLMEHSELILAIAEDHFKIRNFTECEWICEQVLLYQPEHTKALWLLSEAHLQKNEIEAAIYYTEEFVAIATTDVYSHQRLGILWKQIGNSQNAKKAFQKVLELAPESSEAKISKAFLLIDEGQKIEAIQQLESLSQEYSENIGLLSALAELNEALNRTERAIDYYRKILCLNPNSCQMLFKERLILPMLYRSEDEIFYYRQRFTEGLESLAKELTLTTDEEQQLTFSGTLFTHLFPLSYQGDDDVELQRQYGQIVHRTMAAIYPQWMQLSSQRNLGSKIRVGYFSHFIQGHAATQWAFGWLKYHNRENFEIFCYHTGETVDEWTRRFISCCDHFRHLPIPLEKVIEQVLADELDILVFLEIGQVAQTIQIASLRLAPVQCNTWGHPITSGLPNVDYYLSSEFFEEDAAARYYTEKLVRLPKIGISYPMTEVPKQSLDRSYYGLPEDGVIYLCCQSIFKYLPRYDYVFVEIAKRVPDSHFLFIEKPYIPSELFKERLENAFREQDLNSTDYCLFRPMQKNLDTYMNLYNVSDVFLDSLCWGAGNTTLDALACNLPVVTYPGEFLRSRASAGFLRLLDVSETIAHSIENYIELASTLGTNRELRLKVRDRIANQKHQLFEEKSCVEGLENFYRQAVGWQPHISSSRPTLY